MSTNGIAAAVTRALTGVVNPVTGKDVVAGGQVADLEVDDAGRARFVFALRKGDPGTLVRQARAAAEGVDGVSGVKVSVQLPQTATGEASAEMPSGAAAAPRRGRGAPAGTVPGQPHQTGLQPGSVPAPTPRPGILSGVARIVAVSSGKGGVGKSMVATNVAAHAAARGLATGLLDADIYGPSQGIMLGVP
ncbi:MAG: Mrp/NBP35 family ATP-binding protein, partial [Gemmatimonadetes bacterium]|nr:Mrp/NBP35 family ATP-binding protein [Gemmatimonadota bacterium]